MLVMSRKEGDEVIATTPDGVRISFKILETRGNAVRVGVHAPPEVMVNRGEVQRKIDQGENGRGRHGG